MNRERLGKKIEQIQFQIAGLQAQLQELEEQKAAADLAEGHAILQKRKISPEELKFLLSLSEEEKDLILKKRDRSGHPAANPDEPVNEENEDE